MGNLFVNVYILLIAITAIMAVILIIFFRSRRAMPYLTAVCFCLLWWQVCELAFVSSPNIDIVRLVSDIKFVGIALAPAALIGFVVTFYRIRKLMHIKYILFLLIIPATTILLVALGSVQQLFNGGWLPVADGEMQVWVHGPWFWVHAVYSYLLLGSSLVLIYYQHFKLSRSSRLPSTILAAGIALALVTSIAAVILLNMEWLDPSLVAMSISLLFMLVAVALNRQADFYVIARNEIYNAIEECIFIVDNNHVIMDINQSALDCLERYGIQDEDAHNVELCGLLGTMRAEITKPAGEIDDSLDVLMRFGRVRTIYNMRERPLMGRKQKQLGYIVTLTDVTRVRTLINRLEETAGLDPLTGLQNRRTFEQKCAKLDGAQYLPLSVILGDVNKLKHTNDRYGHNQGDMLLQVVADALSDCCPKGACVSRTGGDEFIMLLPNTDETQANAIAALIDRALEGIKDYVFQPSVSLGVAVRERMDVPLAEIINLADIRMYENKNKSRRETEDDR